jgi:hypothetical protein
MRWLLLFSSSVRRQRCFARVRALPQPDIIARKRRTSDRDREHRPAFVPQLRRAGLALGSGSTHRDRLAQHRSRLQRDDGALNLFLNPFSARIFTTSLTIMH